MRVGTGVGIAIGVALAALACGFGELPPSAVSGAVAGAATLAEASGPEGETGEVAELPPELVKILLAGPGGSLADDGFEVDLDLDRRPLRIVLRATAAN